MRGAPASLYAAKRKRLAMRKSIQLPDALLIIFAEDPEVVEIDVAFYNQGVGLTSFLTVPKGTRAVCSRSRSIQILCRSGKFKPRSNSSLPSLMPAGAGASRCRSVYASRVWILGYAKKAISISAIAMYLDERLDAEPSSSAPLTRER
jgi:hypothetical protein